MDAQQSTANSELIDLKIIPVEIAIHRMWMRECPRGKAFIEKEQPSDAWQCFRCGWE